MAARKSIDHIQRVRQICMSLPGATEKLSHGGPTLFVNKRVYAGVSNNHHNDGHVAVWIPAEPGVQAMLIRTSPKKYYKPPYCGVSGWVGIELAEVSDDELGAHLSEAWQLIAAKNRRSR
jgi:hypothetical protein